MRKSMSLLGAAAFFSLTATGASAADVTGVIQTIDLAANAITLSDGKQYAIGPSLKLDSFKAGSKVKATFAVSGNKRTVSKLEAVK